MSDKSNDPQVSLSGYQPDNEASGLDLMAKPLYEAFMKALRDNDQSGESLRFPVVGVLEGRVGHIGRPGIEKAPSIELRFVAVEPVLDRDTVQAVVPSDHARELLRGLYAQLGDDGKKALDELMGELNPAPRQQVVTLMHQLRDVRLGQQPLELEATGGEATARVPAPAKAAAKRARKTADPKVTEVSFTGQ